MSRVLVIDDSQAVRSILCRILKEHGFETEQAANGLLGLQTLNEPLAYFSLFCVDYNMPVMNGMDFVGRMRKIERFAHTPAFMITTENQMDFMHSALEAGVNEFLMKPFTEEMFLQKLEILGLICVQETA